MFTGYIDHCGHLLKVETTPQGRRLIIQSAFKQLTVGESMAINGICLTLMDSDGENFKCDVSAETLSVTTIRDLQPGDLVNLERPLRLKDRLHGHFVLGHIDQTVQFVKREKAGESLLCEFRGVYAHLHPFLVPKGSITVNGVSLTLNEIFSDGFSVMLIPETGRKTNLSSLILGHHVNIEYDYLAKILSSLELKKLERRPLDRHRPLACAMTEAHAEEDASDE